MGMLARDLRVKKTGRHAVVAVKLDVIEGCGDAVPAGHGGRLRSANMGPRSHDDVAEAQRLADQHDFQFDRSASRQQPGAKKIDSGGADVASDQGYRGLLGDSAPRRALARGRIAEAVRESEAAPGAAQGRAVCPVQVVVPPPVRELRRMIWLARNRMELHASLRSSRPQRRQFTFAD